MASVTAQPSAGSDDNSITAPKDLSFAAELNYSNNDGGLFAVRGVQIMVHAVPYSEARCRGLWTLARASVRSLCVRSGSFGLLKEVYATVM